MLFHLLQAQPWKQVDSITQGLMEAVHSASAGLTGVGVGLGSIFVLFVIFKEVSSILDGGRFQIRMLLPIVIYLLVCNFGVVSSVATYLTSQISKQTVEAINKSYSAEIGTKGWIEYMWNAYQSGLDQGAVLLEEKMKELDKESKEFDEYDAMAEPNAGEPEDEKDLNFLQRIGGKIKDAVSVQIKKAWDWIRYNWFKSLSLSAKKTGYNPAVIMFQFGFPMVIAFILEWVGRIIMYIVCCIAAVNIGVIVAFGPITWSFGVFPGNQRVIGAWFIRLVQFSLYAPIVALVDCFTFKIMKTYITTLGVNAVTMGTTGGSAFSPLLVLVVLLANIVCLTAVPTLASMIVEGAAGQISFSQGLQSLMSPVTYLSQFAGMREGQRDADQLEVLKDIRDSLGGGGGGNAGGGGASASGVGSQGGGAYGGGGGGGGAAGQNPAGLGGGAAGAGGAGAAAGIPPVV